MTYNVTTWDEFVAAYKANTGTSTDPDVIEIMNDIDANSNPITSMMRAGSSKIINGNLHNIWNISPGAIIGNTIFAAISGATITFNKINFNNISFLESSPVFNIANLIFNDCTFVAKVADRLVNSATFNRCAITMTGSKNNYPMASVNANYCWMHIEHSRNTTSSNADFYKLYNSYIEGKITTNLTNTLTTPFRLFTYASSSVINLELPDVLKFTTTNAESSSPLSVFNKDKMPNYVNNSTNVIGVTDTQLKDAAYLSGIGFDIVV